MRQVVCHLSKFRRFMTIEFSNFVLVLAGSNDVSQARFLWLLINRSRGTSPAITTVLIPTAIMVACSPPQHGASETRPLFTPMSPYNLVISCERQKFNMLLATQAI